MKVTSVNRLKTAILSDSVQDIGELVFPSIGTNGTEKVSNIVSEKECIFMLKIVGKCLRSLHR